MIDTPKLLIVGPLPPPLTGQSVAVQLFSKHMVGICDITIVDTSKSEFRHGINSLLRLKQVIAMLAYVVGESRFNNLIYYNTSQSVAGNFKDMLVFLLIFRHLSKVVLHLHGGAGMRDLLSDKHPVLRKLNRFFLRRVGAVIVLGDRLKGMYEGMVSPDRLHAVPNFAGDEFFVEPESIAQKFRDIEKLRLLFLSNLLPGKGHYELLAALLLLPDPVRTQIEVDFAGGFESPEEELRFREAAKSVTGTTVNVLGVVHGEQKRELLRRAHLFCLPTYYPYEGQPISILEAYASGCAVLTTDHSGIFDTFTPGRNGFEVKPKAPETIAAVIVEALQNPALLCDYARNNFQDAREKYRAKTHISALQNIIFSVRA